MYGRVLKGSFAILLGGIPFALGISLFVLCLLGGMIVVLVRRYGYKKELSTTFWWALLVVVTIIVMGLKLWPTPSTTASCSTSPLPLYGYLSPPAPYTTRAGTKAPPLSQVDLEVQKFDARRVELLQDAEDSEEGFGQLEDGYSILNSLARTQGLDIGALSDRLSKLRDRLKALAGPGESPLDAIRKRRASLQHYLNEFSLKSKELQESGIGEFDKRFNEGLAEVSLEDVHSDIVALDYALAATVDNAVGGTLSKRIDGQSQLSAAFVEPDSAIELRESVEIALDNAKITRLDASGLEIGSEVLRSRLPGARQSFELFFAGAKQQTPQALSSILIPPGTRDVMVRSILLVPVPLTDTCVKSPLIKFKLLPISWPEPYPVDLTATVNLTGTGIKDYRYRFEPRRDSSIGEIRLPARSFFASNFPFHLERVGDDDVLTPNDPNQKLNLAYFRAQSLWIELLPPEMRYGWVQQHKDLFFRDNAISLVASLWLGSLAAFIVTPKKES